MEPASQEDNPFYEIDPLVHMSYLLSLGPKDLQNACRSNRVYSNICADDDFWRRKLAHDFGIYTPLDDNLSYKQSWIAQHGQFELKDINFRVTIKTFAINYTVKVNGPDYFNYCLEKELMSMYSADSAQRHALARAKDEYPNFDINELNPVYTIREYVYLDNEKYISVLYALMNSCFNKFVLDSLIDITRESLRSLNDPSSSLYKVKFKHHYEFNDPPPRLRLSDIIYVPCKADILLYPSYNRIVTVSDGTPISNAIHARLRSYKFPKLIVHAGIDYEKSDILTADSYIFSKYMFIIKTDTNLYRDTDLYLYRDTVDFRGGIIPDDDERNYGIRYRTRYSWNYT